ncbi:MAG TPA: 2Fe-2S iron-sulfur cluster-binding protein [Porticoccaceae bacterium]|nr:2Fe-2S iron-sulfur cluster-binding protein [Porticoccaceae bacterium]
MIKVTYIEFNGTERTIQVEEGVSLMEAAVSNLVPGIDGDCGGMCACATCHVHVDPAWIDKLPAMESLEDAMLNLAEGRDARSRLACQIKAAPDLDGILVRTPIGQH